MKKNITKWYKIKTIKKQHDIIRQYSWKKNNFNLPLFPEYVWLKSVA